MLTENFGICGVDALQPPLSGDEASQFEALRDALPDGWIVELRPEAGLAWTAFIYCADAPGSRPMFTICRFGDRVGWFAQWMNGVASSATTFRELCLILDLILSSVFAFTQAHLATVTNENWSSAQH